MGHQASGAKVPILGRYAVGGVVRGGSPVYLNEYSDYRIAPGKRAIGTRDGERARAKACGQTVPFLGATPLEAAANLMVKLGHCPHGEAEEVVLCTGEVVAAVCPTCWEALPPSFVGSEWKP